MSILPPLPAFRMGRGGLLLPDAFGSLESEHKRWHLALLPKDRVFKAEPDTAAATAAASGGERGGRAWCLCRCRHTYARIIYRRPIEILNAPVFFDKPQNHGHQMNSYHHYTHVHTHPQVSSSSRCSKPKRAAPSRAKTLGCPIIGLYTPSSLSTKHSKQSHHATAHHPPSFVPAPRRLFCLCKGNFKVRFPPPGPTPLSHSPKATKRSSSRPSLFSRFIYPTQDSSHKSISIPLPLSNLTMPHFIYPSHPPPPTRSPHPSNASMSFPVFYINLADSYDRRARTEHNFGSLWDLRRVEAVDGRAGGREGGLAEATVQRLIEPRSWQMIRKKLSEGYIKRYSPKGRPLRSVRRGISRVEVACILSHLSAVKKAYLEGHERVLIIEDDLSTELMYVGGRVGRGGEGGRKDVYAYYKCW